MFNKFLIIAGLVFTTQPLVFGVCSITRDDALLACQEKAFSQEECDGLSSGCNQIQAGCIKSGYHPQVCMRLDSYFSKDEGETSCDSPVDNAFLACALKGHSPVTCSEFKDECSPGQALCIRKDYIPSSCTGALTVPGRDMCNRRYDNGYVACIGKGHLPYYCTGVSDGCNAPQADCINKGNIPGLCKLKF